MWRLTARSLSGAKKKKNGRAWIVIIKGKEKLKENSYEEIINRKGGGSVPGQNWVDKVSALENSQQKKPLLTVALKHDLPAPGV